MERETGPFENPLRNPDTGIDWERVDRPPKVARYLIDLQKHGEVVVSIAEMLEICDRLFYMGRVEYYVDSAPEQKARIVIGRRPA